MTITEALAKVRDEGPLEQNGIQSMCANSWNLRFHWPRPSHLSNQTPLHQSYSTPPGPLWDFHEPLFITEAFIYAQHFH